MKNHKKNFVMIKRLTVFGRIKMFFRAICNEIKRRWIWYKYDIKKKIEGDK